MMTTVENGDSLSSQEFGNYTGPHNGLSMQVVLDGGLVMAGIHTSGYENNDFWCVRIAPDTTCIGDTPASPNDVVLTIEGNSARLTWSPVTRDTNGCLVNATHYVVFNSLTSDGPFSFLGINTHVLDTAFVHSTVISYADRMFYEVVALSGIYPTALNLPVGTPKQEVLELRNSR